MAKNLRKKIKEILFCLKITFKTNFAQKIKYKNYNQFKKFHTNVSTDLIVKIPFYIHANITIDLETKSP